MSALLILLAVGTVLLFMEVILPSGIFGIIAGLCYMGAVWFAWDSLGLVPAIVTGVICCVLGICAVLSWAYVLPRTRLGKKILPKPDVVESAESPLAGLVGREGAARTNFNPAGKILIDAELYDAQSVSGPVKKGAPLQVVSADFYELKVRALSESEKGSAFDGAASGDSHTLERQIFNAAQQMEAPLPKMEKGDGQKG